VCTSPIVPLNCLPLFSRPSQFPKLPNQSSQKTLASSPCYFVECHLSRQLSQTFTPLQLPSTPLLIDLLFAMLSMIESFGMDSWPWQTNILATFLYSHRLKITSFGLKINLSLTKAIHRVKSLAQVRMYLVNRLQYTSSKITRFCENCQTKHHKKTTFFIMISTSMLLLSSTTPTNSNSINSLSHCLATKSTMQETFGMDPWPW
jgi:hypothetical protein